ncbi:hypothetical protein PRZ48_012473 [Zasmidium cellare]|uniref:Formate/nitrite transporter n=1 Tax=Zasmidium cellare TaxID=395010 RepID=A0ABR0E5E6_ZASCE|nr:hypothetical protein PRZ48_012473 [Zasmidium cellare]
MQDHIHVISNAYTPKETVEQVGRSGVYKANMRIDKMFISSVVAGMLLAFACAVSLSTQTSPWYQDHAPGLIRMIGAVIFPFGLVMIVVTGVDLCTGSFMITLVSVLQRRLSVPKMLLHWFVTFWGNLAGSLFVVAIITGYGGVFDLPPYNAEAITFANKKVVTPQWHMIFLRGIGANWLVCMACFLAFMAREYFSKVIAIWWPTFAFVALGLDHVVATLIGNIIGGGLFVGAAYWYLHLTNEPPVPIDGVYFSTDKEPLLTLGSMPWKSGGGPGPASGDNSPRREDSQEGKKSAEAMVDFYDEGKVLSLNITSQEQDVTRTVTAKILELRQPFTLSCVMIVEVISADLNDLEPQSKAVLKLYDRRFAAQLRKDEGVPPWSESAEEAFLELVRSGEAATFVHKLRNEDDFEEPDEGWSPGENEAYLHDMCSDLFATETRAYDVLKELQGKAIPKLYSAVSLPLDTGTHGVVSEAGEEEFFAISGILIEYISGPTVSDMADVIPQQSWQIIVNQAVQIVRRYSRLGILNKDVRCSNFVVNQSVPDGDEHRVVMLDFALCEFKEPEQSEVDWGRAKWNQDEEGAIGAVMRTRLAKLGFQLEYTPSHEWIGYAARE